MTPAHDVERMLGGYQDRSTRLKRLNLGPLATGTHHHRRDVDRRAVQGGVQRPDESVTQAPNSGEALLITDETGDQRIDQHAASRFIQLISRRIEKGDDPNE